MKTKLELPTILSIVAFLFCVFSSAYSNNGTDCPIYLKEFSENLTIFLDCALIFSQPVALCTNCVRTFVLMTKAYDTLKMAQSNETVSEGQSCHDLYIDQDRLNILQSLYNDGNNLWERGHCRNCYNWVDQQLDQNLTDIIQKFFGIINYTRTCMLNYDQDNEYCEFCQDTYSKLNHIYADIQTQSADVCFDVQDAMNKTRSAWSRGGCNIVPSSQTYFFIVSGIVCFIPIVFYTSMVVYTKRKEAGIMLSETDLLINESLIGERATTSVNA